MKNTHRWHTFVVGIWTGFSRVLGLVRDMLMTYFFGISLFQSAFAVAFTIPNLFRRLFGEGALSASFVPAFSSALTKEGKAEAEKMGRRVLMLLMVFLTTLVVAGIGITYIIGWLAEGNAKITTPLPFLRIMFPYAIFICMAAQCMGMLTALKDFRTAAFSPAILNLVWIAVLLGVCPFITGEERRIIAVSCGVTVAGVLQFSLQWRRLRRMGWFKGVATPPSPSRNITALWRDSKVAAVWKNAIPAAIGAGVVQINVCMDFALAMWANPWAPATLKFAEHLVYLPLGLVSTAMGTVLLPAFSRQFAENDTEGMKLSLSEAMKDIALIMIPATVGLVILAHPITALLYERGAFTELATLRTARALAVYAPGLVVFSLQKIITPLFYGMHDMRTPMRLSVITVVINAAFNVTFILTLPSEWKHVGIAASTVLCTLGLSVALCAIAQRRIGALPWRPILSVTGKAVLAAAAMGAAAHFTYHAAAQALPRLAALSLAIALALLLYAALLSLLYPGGARHLLALLRRRKR